MERKRFAGVLVKYQDTILLCKRNSKAEFPGMWSIPAGGVEQDESTMEAAKREFFEETAIDIKNKDINFIGILPRTTRDGNKTKGLMYVYKLETDLKLEPDLNSAVDGDEHTDWGYFDKTKLKNLNMGKHMKHLVNLFI